MSTRGAPSRAQNAARSGQRLKFGVFFLGLAVSPALRSLGSALRTGSRARQAPRGNLMMLDGRGSQLGVMVSDLDAKEGAGVKIDEVTSGQRGREGRG